MTRSDFLRACTRTLGRPVPAHIAGYAIRSGQVPRPKLRPDGWLDYGPEQVTAMVAYCRQRPGRSRRSAAKATPRR